MAYQYYHATPGWGTNQYAFGLPPAPTFQPQPSWGGFDYYRAHALSPDHELYNHAWGLVQDYRGMGDIGVGMHEARIWHRRAYGGVGGELGMMLPHEIGHAAAYEAYRTWIHNSAIHEPLIGDTERQREGLIGYAIAEATRLMQYSNRPFDQYARMSASDAAAGTASTIFYQSLEDGYHHRGRSHSRYGHYGSGFDPYAVDDIDVPFYRQGMYGGAGSMYGGAGSMYGGAGSMYGGAPMYGGAGSMYGGAGSMYGGAGSMYGGAGSMYGGAHPGAIAIPGSYPHQPYDPYGGVGYPGSYGSYAGSMYGGGFPATYTPGVTVVKSSSGRSHRRRSRSRHHHKSGSSHSLILGGPASVY